MQAPCDLQALSGPTVTADPFPGSGQHCATAQESPWVEYQESGELVDIRLVD